MSTPKDTVEIFGKKARAGALAWGTVPAERKNRVLDALAQRLKQSEGDILAANAQDVEASKAAGLSAALIDRLTLNPKRIDAMIEGVRQVAALPDPVGEELERTLRPNGLVIRKVRVPIGVIAVIYESRPNVTVDCAALCLKSGNAAILRGGKEAIHSNKVLAGLVRAALEACGETPDAVQWIDTPDREVMRELLQADQYVHCVIPRGGEGLIRFVAENARMPVLKHFNGICTVYLDRAADPAMAEAIIVNAKAQRPSACNAAENLLVHSAVADTLLPRVAKALTDHRVALRADEKAGTILTRAGLAWTHATEADWSTEYLDYILSVKLVDNTQAAIDFINRYGSAHSDAIVTADKTQALAFQQGVDSATVFWNASTRFNDGFEFGLGAEIGISTDRLHARGPVGLRELCSYKYLIEGDGQVRG